MNGSPVASFPPRALARRLLAVVPPADANYLLRDPGRSRRYRCKHSWLPATEVALVVTRPDRRRGRGEAGSSERRSNRRRAIGAAGGGPACSGGPPGLIASGATIGVVVAYGQILRPEFLAALPDGFVNLHFSLLPRWRGAGAGRAGNARGRQETGVCLMRVDQGLDTGGVYASARLTIGADETAG